MELPTGPQAASLGASTQVSQEQDELTQRLARLRQAEWSHPKQSIIFLFLFYSLIIIRYSVVTGFWFFIYAAPNQ